VGFYYTRRRHSALECKSLEACIVFERYRDSEALIEHMANLGDLGGAILATVSLVHGEVLGEPSAELRAKMADSVVRLFTPYLSM
jgi:hypothetical protein